MRLLQTDPMKRMTSPEKFQNPTPDQLIEDIGTALAEYNNILPIDIHSKNKHRQKISAALQAAEKPLCALLYRTVEKIEKNVHDAKDIVHDYLATKLLCLERPVSFQGRSSFKTYLISSIKRHLYSYKRTQKNQHRILDEKTNYLSPVFPKKIPPPDTQLLVNEIRNEIIGYLASQRWGPNAQLVEWIKNRLLNIDPLSIHNEEFTRLAEEYKTETYDERTTESIKRSIRHIRANLRDYLVRSLSYSYFKK